MDVFEFERLFVELGLFVGALELPRADIGEVLVVTHRFAVIRLVLGTEVAAAGFFAVQGVLGQNFGELEEVGQTTGVLQLLVGFASTTSYNFV